MPSDDPDGMSELLIKIEQYEVAFKAKNLKINDVF